jgi:hypothetical protein
MEIIDLLKMFLTDETIATIIKYVAALIALSNVITMLFPSVIGNKIYDAVMKVLNFLSLNILKNKNADDVNGK